MEQSSKNPNIVTSVELLIDEKEDLIRKRIEDSRKLVQLAEDALPIAGKKDVVLTRNDRLAARANDTVESIKVFFSKDSDYLVNEGLRAMGAKLSKGEWCDNDKTMQQLELVATLHDLNKENDRPDIYDRTVTTIAWLRAAKMAEDKLSESKSRRSVGIDEIVDELHNNPQILEKAYKELQEKRGEKVKEFMNFVDEHANDIDEILSEATALNTSKSIETNMPLPQKDHIIGEDVANLNICLEDAGLVQLAMIPTPYEEFVDLNDLPEKQATAVILERAYLDLEKMGGHRSGMEGVAEFSIDHGLRALEDKLGDPQYHGPRYDVQLITFALRFDQLVKQAESDPSIKEKIKNVAIFMRSAKLAENELRKTKGFFMSSTEVAEKANDPEMLQRAQRELTAYNGVMFDDFYKNMAEIGSSITEGLETYKKHPEWRDW